MRPATVLVLSLLSLAACERKQDGTEPNPQPPAVVVPEEWDRITANVIRADADGGDTTRHAGTADASAWMIMIAGRWFPFDDAGLTSFETLLQRFADERRSERPPHFSERSLIVRVDPGAPSAMTTSLLQRAVRAGFYKFSFREPIKAMLLDASRPTSRR